MYRTRRLNRLLYFNVILDAPCKFATRQNYVYDRSTRIIKNPLNSTTIWTRRLNSATRPLNSATRQIIHCNIEAYFDEALYQLWRRVHLTRRRVRSTPRRVKNAIMTPMAYHRGERGYKVQSNINK